MKTIKKQYITNFDKKAVVYKNCIFSSKLLQSEKAINKKSNIINCSFKHESFNNELCSKLNNCFFVDCIFDNQNLSSTVFIKCKFVDCIWLTVDISNTTFKQCYFIKNTLYNIETLATFKQCKIIP